MNEGDWVSGIYVEGKFTGYVLENNNDNLLIQCTLPNKFGVIKKRIDEVVLINDSALGIDQLNNLMKLAIKTNDKDWINTIKEELSLWKGISYLKEE